MIENINISSLPLWMTDSSPVRFGGMMLCTSGSALASHNFRKWDLSGGTVLTFFPNDILRIGDVSDDFSARLLTYSPELLRSASLQIEDVVYEWLRKDCCNSSKQVFSITSTMFTLLELYAVDIAPEAFEKILLLQLKAYFTGLYDRVRRYHMAELIELKKKNRFTEQFNNFMSLLEKEYKGNHSVAYYASRLCVTPKHLTAITKRVAGKSAKELIDDYLIIQIKLALSETSMSIKEIAWDFNFSTFAFFCRFFSSRVGISPLRYRHGRKESGQ